MVEWMNKQGRVSFLFYAIYVIFNNCEGKEVLPGSVLFATRQFALICG
jgi:hypothetical protein